MSLVVRHKDTGCYLQAHDSWTKQLESAMHFHSGLRLVDYIEHGGVHGKLDRIEVIVIPSHSAETLVPANAALPS